ncbi:uncharacterized protein LOC144109802 [Amblyomma americanum]
MAACYTDASPTAPTAAQARMQAKKSRKCYTAQEDLCLLREVAATRPFGDDIKWMTVIANVKQAISRELTLRGVKDRIDLLIGYWRQQDARNLKKSGTEEQYSEKEQILQDLSDYARAINYEPRIIPRSGGSVLSRKRQATTDRTTSVKRSVMDTRAGSTTLVQAAEGIRGLQNLGLQLLTMREANEYELRQREIQNKKEKIAIEKQKADNETRRIALEERKLELEERKHQLEVSRHERDNEKLLDSIQKMFNAQRNEMLEFLNGNHT